MTIFNSKLDQNSTSFKSNISDHLALIDQMRLLEKRTIKKSEKRKPVFLERGQLTPRERLFSLLDPGLPFLELFNFAGYLVDDTSPETSCPGANMIMGIGFVNGIRCFVWVDDSGINAGATTTKSMEKGLAGIAVAKKQKLPFVHLVESAGANLMAYTVDMPPNSNCPCLRQLRCRCCCCFLLLRWLLSWDLHHSVLRGQSFLRSEGVCPPPHHLRGRLFVGPPFLLHSVELPLAT